MGRGKRRLKFRWNEVCVVHTVQRCVRRAFLAGPDERTKIDYSHRRQWIREKLQALASVYAIDVLNYAILSNHVHLVIRNRPDVVKGWSEEELAVRWLRAFPGTRLGEEHLGEPTIEQIKSLLAQKKKMRKIRKRMSDISWFMRSVAEPIARKANKEDKCTGHFWEGRFKAQRIVDEAGLLTCAMYVDLNPIRAAMAESVMNYVHTSAYDRMEGAKGQKVQAQVIDFIPAVGEETSDKPKPKSMSELDKAKAAAKSLYVKKEVLRDAWLAPLTMDPNVLSSDPQAHQEGVRASDKGYLNMSLEDYQKLLEWTATLGRDAAVSTQVPAHLADLISRLKIEPTMWRELVWNFKGYFGRSGCAGSPEAMKQDAANAELKWHPGQKRVRACFQK